MGNMQFITLGLWEIWVRLTAARLNNGSTGTNLVLKADVAYIHSCDCTHFSIMGPKNGSLSHFLFTVPTGPDGITFHLSDLSDHFLTICLYNLTALLPYSLRPSLWKQFVPPKRWHTPVRVYGVTTQKITIWITFTPICFVSKRNA
jgi:hypothetical protein